MPKYNIFDEGIKDAPLRFRIKHRIMCFLTRIRLDYFDKE